MIKLKSEKFNISIPDTYFDDIQREVIGNSLNKNVININNNNNNNNII
jgi:hypothetical protein